MPISLVFWVRGYPKRGDAHITVTTAKGKNSGFENRSSVCGAAVLDRARGPNNFKYLDTNEFYFPKEDAFIDVALRHGCSTHSLSFGILQ